MNDVFGILENIDWILSHYWRSEMCRAVTVVKFLGHGKRLISSQSSVYVVL
jgi:hypothetical protein